MPTRLLLCLSLVAGLAAETQHLTPQVGLWGDRSGVYPESDPSIAWDYDGGYNILWHTPTPNFGYSAPTVVGTTVVVLCEPSAKDPYPLVVGYDLDSGAEKWRRELNPLPLTIADETRRTEIDGIWRSWLQWREDFLLLRRDYGTATDKAALVPRFAALGLKVAEDGSGAFGNKWPGKDAQLPDAPMGADWKIDTKVLGAAGLSLDNWGKGYGGYYFGECFVTPVSDGKAAYVQLAWSLWAAFDADGKQLWLKQIPAPLWGEYCMRGRSPLLWRDRLIADQGDMIHALKTATGEVVWSFDRKAEKIGQHEMMSPMVVSVAGTDYLYANGRPPFVLRLEDGKVFRIEGLKNCGIVARVNPDQPDVLFLSGGGEHGGWDKNEKEELAPLAIRLKLDGETMKSERLWSGIDGKPYGSQVSWKICYDGKLYFRNVVLDAATGEVLRGSPGKDGWSAMPRSTYSLAIVGGGTRGARIYGQGNAEHGSEKRKDDLGARVESDVYTLDGRPMAKNILRGLPGQADMRTRMHLPNWFNYANNFTVVGNRILTRSCNEVICIGSLDDLNPVVVKTWAGELKGWDAIAAALFGEDKGRRQAALVALKDLHSMPETEVTQAIGRLLPLVTGDDPDTSTTATRALMALGPKAKPAFSAVLAEAAKLPPENDYLFRRLRWILGGMGTGVEDKLTAMIDSGDDAQYILAIQVASYMQDFDCATRLLARAQITAKPPRFSPWLYPREGGQELTLRDIITTALIGRADKSSAGAELLAVQLTEPNERDGAALERFMFAVRAIAPAKPELLLPHLSVLRKYLRHQAGDARLGAALTGLAALGPKAKEALPEMRTWLEEERAKEKPDANLVKRLEQAAAAVAK